MILEDVKTQASWFNQARSARRAEIVEDYVELIADLSMVSPDVRLSDVSQRLGVSSASASKVMLKLQERGYIETRPYRSIYLTDKGKQLAQQCRYRHQVVVEFLICIGVPSDIAKSDAEGIEHHISEQTLQCFQEHIERCRGDGKG